MKITSPSGRTYQWDKSEPPTADDMTALQAYDAQQSKAEPATKDPNADLYYKDGEASPDGLDYLKAAFGRGSPKANEDVKAAMAIDRGTAGNVAQSTAMGVGAGAGQTIGSSMGLPGRILGGGIGAGVVDAASQAANMLQGDQDKFQWGRLGASVLGGAVPGGTSAKGSIQAVIKEAAKQGVTGVGAKTIQTVVDEGRLPTGGEATVAGGLGAVAGGVGQKMQSMTPEAKAVILADLAKNAPKYQAIDAAKRLNISVKPTEVNPDSAINKTLESIAGRGALTNSLKIRNEQFADAAARRHAGLDPNAPLTTESLESARQGMVGPYKEVEAMSDSAIAARDALKKEKFTSGNYHELEVQMNDPETVAKLGPLATQAGADIKQLKAVRSNAVGLHRQNAAQYNYETQVKADALDAEAEILEGRIAEAAQSAGKPELVTELADARKAYAQNYDVERSLNQLTGHINPQKVGAMAQKNPRKLTGDLADLAAVQKNFPDALGTGRSIQDPGSSGTNMLPAVMAATSGSPSIIAKIASAGLPLARGPARSVLMSPTYQSLMAQPQGPKITPDIMAAILREAIKAKGRQ